MIGDRLSPVARLFFQSLFAFVFCLLSLTAVGCSREVVDVENPYTLASAEYNAIFLATKDALRQHGFKLDRVDYRFGTITTKPLTSPTMLEPWHGGNTTAEQAAESTVNNQRRYVTVTLEGYYKPGKGSQTITIRPGDDKPAPDKSSTPAPAEIATTAPTPENVAPLAATTQPAGRNAPYDGYHLRVAVFVERLEDPDRRLGGSGSSRRMFDELNTTPAELRERGISGPYWLPIGRDPYLENRLIASVVRLSIQK